MTLVPQQVLDKARLLSTATKRNFLELSKVLYQIRKEELFKPKYESFREYLEEDIKISEGFASKLIGVYETFAEVENKRLLGIDLEKLYLARKIEGTVEQKLTAAETLTRGELKQELAIKDGVECEHLTTIHICSNCHQRVG